MEIIHYHFSTINSTNEWGRSHMHELSPHKITLVTADGQTDGRGQQGRHWVGPSGLNLYASFCFFIDLDQKDPFSLTHVMALCIIDLLEKKGMEGRIKWPQ